MTSAVRVHPKPLRASVPANSASPVEERKELMSKAELLFHQASELAAAGDINEAGLLILKGLDCERRAKAQGPQVLGLIKRRA